MKLLFNTTAIMILVTTGCRSPFYADRGAAVGGASGAGIGAVIGEATADEPLAGAAIGGAIGAITGAVVGNELDQFAAAQQHASAGTVTLQDVAAMAQNGLSDDVIISHIRANGLAVNLTSSELIALRQSGVSNEVLRALQSPAAFATPVRGPAVVPVVYEPPPVVMTPWGPHRHWGCGPRGRFY